MRMVEAVALSIGLSLAVASTADADVQVRWRAGRVSIVAKDATVGEILAEWARVGQTQVVNADMLSPELVTIEMNDVSEAHALDVLLRKACGYLAVPRSAILDGVSRFDRILVMRASTTPVAVPATAPAAAAAPPADQALADPDDAADAAASNAVQSGAGAGVAAREATAGIAATGAIAGSNARAVAAEQARADGGIGGDDPPAPDQPAVPQSPPYQAPGTGRESHRPPVRPMPSGQMSERRAAAAAANEVARDRRASTPAPPAQDFADRNGVDPSLLAPVPIPPQDPQAQEAFRQRQAVEVADPRTFKFELKPPAVAKPASPSAAKPGVVTRGPGGEE